MDADWQLASQFLTKFAGNGVTMFSTGYSTIILYLASLTLFMFAMFYQSFFIIGVALGTLFFIIASIIIAIMVKKRINT